MLKKSLAIILTLALTLTLVPMSVFAVGNKDVQTQATSGNEGNCGIYSNSSGVAVFDPILALQNTIVR